MKLITVENQITAPICVIAFGKEEISKDARYRKCVRPSYILHYVLSGEGFFNGRRVREGEGFLITPDAVSEYHSSEDKPWKYFFVIFNGDGAPELISRYVRSDGDGIFRLDRLQKLMSLADGIVSEAASISDARALGYFYMLMSLHERTEQRDENRHVHAAKKYIDINLYRSPSVSEVAREIKVSDRYLYNLFVKHEGISPKKYISDLRVQRAKAMLKNTVCSVSEVGGSVGFSDVLAFSRFFAKSVGVSPTAYRRGERACGSDLPDDER